MKTQKSFDTKEFVVGYILISYAVLVFTIFILKPLSAEGMRQFTISMMLIPLIVCLFTCYRTLQLYGPRSNEGKFWLKIIIMMVLFTFGLVFDGVFGGKYHSFAIFALMAFLIVCWGMLERVRNAGLKIRAKNIGFSLFVIAIICVFIALFMRHLSDLGLSNLEFKQYWLEIIVVLVAFACTFLSIIMGSLMGGHLSKGWYFLALGAIIFSITFTLTTVLSGMGIYEDFIFLETFEAVALNSVTFSAYYQRKRHLEMIESVI